MAKTLMSLSMLSFVLLLCFSSGTTRLANGQVAQKTWCVAKPSLDDTALQNNLNYVCSEIDCSVFRMGGSCYSPDFKISHASIAMNLYYQTNKRHTWNCHFNNSGLIVLTDPSYDNCNYPYF
ncbi:glucan endo-1,3-beta-D-glucosidase-like [Tasmannia lanceolata]|uniref:glucan endo-1,3-beta-D-glucosidase-like n=1 Tax=Tasmannia lanceolata TaxID=3420 RepID=UPI0040633ABA